MAENSISVQVQEKEKEKLLQQMRRKPVPVIFFRDLQSDTLFQMHYEGLGSYCAIAVTPDINRLVCDLLNDGTLMQTDRMVACAETVAEKHDSSIVLKATTTHRSGYEIEIMEHPD